MNQPFKKAVACLFLLLSSSLFAQSWQSELTHLLNTQLPEAQIGVMVVNAETGKLLYKKEANKAFTPASNVKLFTSMAAIHSLGPNYRFKTTLSLNSKQFRHGIVYGNVYIKFTGDPSLKNKDLKNLLVKLKKFGVKRINGNIILADSRFRAPNYAPGWTQDSVAWAFSAPITSIILNQNRVYLKLLPSKTIGQPVDVLPGKNMKYMQFQHYVNTVSYQHAKHNCSLLLSTNDKNVLALGGCWPTGVPGWKSFAVKHPALFAEHVIRYYLVEEGIKLQGRIKTGREPRGLRVISRHASKPLSELIKKVLKHSNNLYTESITKTLGYQRTGRGTFLEGSNAIKAIDAHLTDIDFDKARIVDGSGQSRYDLLTPHQLVRLLQVVYDDKHLRRYIVPALPTSGVSGTLKYRMTSADMKGRVKAKTGSMTGVSTLSGYVTTKNKQTLIFSLMMNHLVGKVKPARELQNQICELLALSA